MKWQILLFPLLTAALPQQGDTRAFRPRDIAANNTGKFVWAFDPNYDPDALVKQSEISGSFYSKQNWNFRKVGNWLIEYAIQQKVQDSDDFFVALYNTPAFGSDTQQVCGLTPSGDNCEGGQRFNGATSPFHLTNDEFNAQLVRQAIRNTYVYYRTLWQAIGDASREASPRVGKMVVDLGKPLVVEPSGASKALNILGAFVQFAAVFFPVEGIIANIAGSIVRDEIKALEAGTVFFRITEEGAQNLLDLTTKELTKNYEMIKDVADSGKDLIVKLAKIEDETDNGPDTHMFSDVLDYQAAADQYSRHAQTFLEDTWNAILNKGFSDGGIISQIFTGDVLDLRVSTTGPSTLDDHGSRTYGNAVSQYFNYLMQRTMTKILADHGVRVIKRGSYSSVQDCQKAYDEKSVAWVAPAAHGCFGDSDRPGRYSQYFPMVTGSSYRFEKKTYSGVQALLRSTWGSFSFDGPAFYHGAVACTKANGLWANASTKFDKEWSPQYTPPRMPDGTSQTLDANKLTCAFSAPACNFEDVTFANACSTYKSKLREKIFSMAREQGLNMLDSADDTGGCGDRELQYFCLIATEQGPDFTFTGVAQTYINFLDHRGYGWWGGLAGFEQGIQNRIHGGYIG
ncbi:hypothetical protein NLU13_0001 [Sarocladium strictum]|uniref:Uncharacterized protein n=1 Tax=Sarocladium strictum TaxID=5046 RepID=A0AA39LAV8_SARSR|nr:hypothetical protein NLU13_0001 [Sarocladium strictum]